MALDHVNAFLVANKNLTHVTYTWESAVYSVNSLDFDPRIFTGCARLQSLKLPESAAVDGDAQHLTDFLSSAPLLHTLFAGGMSAPYFDAICVSYVILFLRRH